MIATRLGFSELLLCAGTCTIIAAIFGVAFLIILIGGRLRERLTRNRRGR